MRFNPLSTGHAPRGQQILSCPFHSFNPLSTGHARSNRGGSNKISSVYNPLYKVTQKENFHRIGFFFVFQSNLRVTHSMSRFYKCVSGFNPIYGSRTMKEVERMNTPCFNPLSTGHARKVPALATVAESCFNPLSTGHAHLPAPPCFLLIESFNPLSTGHALI